MCETCSSTVASFGVPGGPPTHCKKHKAHDMVDVTNKMCEMCGDVRANFGAPGGRATHCEQHKAHDMVNVLSKMCETCGALRASYGLPGGPATHCFEHRTNDMIYLSNGVCESCGVQPVYKNLADDGLCMECHPDYVPSLVGASKIACEWIDRLERELGRPIQHTHYDVNLPETVRRDEYRAPCLPRCPVDGYDAVSKTIYEFHGDEWHGHPHLWPKIYNHKGKKHEDLFRKTETKLRTLTEHGYRVYYMWESEYRKSNALESLHVQCREFTTVLEPVPCKQE